MATELKPCPFCGGEATMWHDYGCDRPYNILCGCGGRAGWFVTESEAAEAWNRRTIIETNIYDKEETYPNCTVQVLTNTVTGETSVGWWKNEV